MRSTVIRPQRADEAGVSEAMRRPSASRSFSTKTDRILFLQCQSGMIHRAPGSPQGANGPSGPACYSPALPGNHPTGDAGMKRAALGLLATLTALAALWGAAAIWIDGPASRSLAGLLVAAFLVSVAVVLARVRPHLHACLWALAPCAAVLCWWLSIRPSNDRDWQPDVARTPTAERQGSVVTVRDVRDFDYRTETDFTERWEERRYDLDRVVGLDLFVIYWGPTLYAHTILSWDFEDSAPLAASIETRKEKGESYSALLGFFRQFELVYVLADERDVVRLRTNYRGERVFLYRLATSRAGARALLEQYLEEANTLAREPAWYNAFTENCTTSIWRNVRAISPGTAFDWRLLANGYLDQLAYERGLVDTSLPFAELRQRSDVTERAKACGSRDDFSRCIREGLPTPQARRR